MRAINYLTFKVFYMTHTFVRRDKLLGLGSAVGSYSIYLRALEAGIRGDICVDATINRKCSAGAYQKSEVKVGSFQIVHGVMCT